jgi:outer membrane lipoprotein-sorting protein
MRFDVVRRKLAALVLATLLPGAAFAITDAERAILGEISQKLATLKTLNGEFVQFNPDGTQQEGEFYIARPGKVRFQYNPPATVSVIADGKSVLVFDKKLQTYDIWPLSQTPLRLLLDDNLDLASSNRVTGVS